MPRKPTLRRKKVGKSVYWFTKAGGETYFGNVADLTYDEAKRFFAAHIKNLAEDETTSKSNTVLTAGELILQRYKRSGVLSWRDRFAARLRRW
jgi:hypothetical protein